MVRHGRSPSSSTVLFVVISLLVSTGFVREGHAQVLRAQAAKSPTPLPTSSSSPQPNAIGTFMVASTVALSGTPSTVAAGDLNGDGRLDLAVVDSITGKVSILLGMDKGKFAAPVAYTVGKQPVFLAIADVNGDAKPDLVVCNEADGTISVLLGNGDGSFSRATDYLAVTDPAYVVAGDFNHDGETDLAVAGKSSGAIAVLLNDGTGNFGKPALYNLGRTVVSLAVGDFTGKGNKDLAAANADGTVAILLGNGDGSFRTPSLVPVGSAAISSITAADFNSDQKIDLAVTQAGTKLVSILQGNGDGTFHSSGQYAVDSVPSSLAAADVNSDNVTDLITVNQSANSFSVLLGVGDGTFKPSIDFVAGNSPRALAVGDFNRDGSPDLAIANFVDKTISLAFGRGDGTFNAARAYSVDLDRKSLAAGDLDGDGKPDLVVTNFCGTDATCTANGTASVLLGVGDGTYKLAGNYPLGAGPLSVSLADVNGDQKLDLMAVNRGDKSVSVLLGNGDGTFQSALTYPLGNSPVALVTGDFNSDHKLDLAVVGDCGSAACAQPGEVSVLLGNGDGSFQAAGTYAVGYSPSALAAGDLNGSTNLAIVVANACGQDSSCRSGTATVLLGNGKGAFHSGGELPLGKGPSALTLGDLNGDGALDLVSAYRAENKIGLLLGNGDATFKPQVTYPVGSAPSAVVISDFNGDGKRDVAVADFKDSRVSVLFGNGDGTLQPAANYSVGAGPESLIAVESSHLGRADLVSANGNGGLLPRGSDITVLRNQEIQTGSNPTTTTITCTAGNCGNSTYGDSLTFTAVVAGDPLIGSPTGTVSFTDNGNSIDPKCDLVALFANGDNQSSTAVCTTQLLKATPTKHTNIVATYSGDFNYDSSFGTAPEQDVTKATPTFGAITQPDNPSLYGDLLTFQVVLNGISGAAPPTGNAVFKDGANTLCTSLLVPDGSNGQATCVNPGPGNSPPPLGNGPHTIVATYSNNSDPNYGPAVPSPNFHQVVSAASPSFSGLPASQSIDFGKPSINLSGTISATNKQNQPVYPQKGENITVTIGPKQQPTKISNDVGSFSLTFDTSTIPASGTQYQIHYHYSGPDNGDNNFGTGDDISTTLTVAPATTTVTLTVMPPNSSSYLQDVQFTIVVKPEFTGTPTGTVTVFDQGNNAICSANLQSLTSAKGNALKSALNLNTALPQDGSIATCERQDLGVGPYTFHAHYQSDTDNFLSNDSMPPQPYTVSPAATTTVLTGNPPSPTQYLQPVTLTATVTGAFGGSPRGTVNFTDSIDGPLCSNVTLVPQQSGSTAMCVASSPSVNPNHKITAKYNGDDPDNHYSASPPSDPILYEVDAADTTTTLSGDPPSPSSYNQDIKFTATVTGKFGGDPTGTVTFTYDNVLPPLCTLSSGSMKVPNSKASNVLASGKNATQVMDLIVTCDVPNGLPVGSHTVQAQYSGDPNFNHGDPATLPYSVNKATTTTHDLTADTHNTTYNSPVMLSATVSAQYGGTLGGTVDFTDDGNAIANCTGLTLDSNGKASCTTRSLSGGTHSMIFARYSGDGNSLGSSGGPLAPPITVHPDSTSTTLTANPGNSTFGESVTFTATVTTGNGELPTGTVGFMDGNSDIVNCSAVPFLNNTNTAMCTTSSLAPGAHQITAKYPDTPPNFSGSSGMIAAYQVNPATTSTSLTADPSKGSVYLQPVTFTATVTVTSKGGGNPTGAVSFVDSVDGMLCSNIQLAPQSGGGSTAICVARFTVNKNHKITAQFLGNAFFGSSYTTSNAYPVTQAGSKVTVASGTSPSDVNQLVLFTATPIGDYGGSPSGNVMFTSSAGAIPECPAPKPLMNGQASCSTRSLPVGTPSVIATYLGDGNFQSSAPFALPQEVDKTKTATTITPNLNPSVYKQPVTFSIVVAPQFSMPFSIGGSVTLSIGNTAIPECQNIAVTATSTGIGEASCHSASIPAGDPVVIDGLYSGDSNFLPSSTTIKQTVRDFSLAVTPTQSQITPVTDSNGKYVVTVIQGYTNQTQPSFAYITNNPPNFNQTITVSATPIFKYSNSLNLSCAVTLVGQMGPNQINPLCSVARGQIGPSGMTTVAIDASNKASVGTYVITVTAIDATGVQLSHSDQFTLLIASNIATLNVSAGAPTSASVSFASAAASNVTFSCISPPAGISCAFNPSPANLDPASPLAVNITITAAQTTSLLRTPTRIFATFWFGLPAVVWIGLVPFRKQSLKIFLRMLLMLMIVLILLQAIGCGGGSFSRPPGTQTQVGSYNLLVEATDSTTNQVVSSAVVPINVSAQ